VSCGLAEKPVVDQPTPASVAAQYEALRRAALGEPVLPACRSGLVLFLRRGMWGWTRSLARATSRQLPTHSWSAGMAPDHGSAVIQVFAAMALSPNDRRAR